MTEERKEHTASARVTQAEKDALQLVALWDQTTESDLMRNWTVAEVVERASEIRALHPGGAS